MKPVLKKETSYSVLFMRDDCGVMRFRMRAFWMKALCVFIALLTGAAGAGGWAAHHYWKKHNALITEHRELERELAENRLQLERLANLEKFLQARDNEQAVLNVNAANATAPVQAAISAAVNGSPIGVAGQTPEERRPQDSAIKISNASLRASGNARLRLSFDLVNQDPQTPLTGRVYLAVMTAAEQTLDLTGPDEELRFSRIARYKRISTTISLPQDLPAGSVTAVRVSIDAEGLPVFTEQLPMP